MSVSRCVECLSSLPASCFALRRDKPIAPTEKSIFTPDKAYDKVHQKDLHLTGTGPNGTKISDFANHFVNFVVDYFDLVTFRAFASVNGKDYDVVGERN